MIDNFEHAWNKRLFVIKTNDKAGEKIDWFLNI